MAQLRMPESSSLKGMEQSLCPRCHAWRLRVGELEAENLQLKHQLERALCASKRQAAPFSKGPPKKQPKKPGRKPGNDYGPKAHRLPPAPEQIDEVHDSPLPEVCPDCGGPIQESHVAHQFQVEIPRRPIHRRFDIHIGRCLQCQQRIQGRHPLQTSDALGAAASQLGPDAQAAVVELNKNAGLSHGKVASCLKNLFGICLTPGGSVHTVLRAAQRCEPIYQVIRAAVRQSPWAVPDETGWRVGGWGAWLHGVVAVDATAYEIDPTRSGAVTERLLGLDYRGLLIHDGWSPYDQFEDARHQQCLQHLLRRSAQLLETARPCAKAFPRRIAQLLGKALDLRDRHAAGEVSDRGRAIARGRLQMALFDAIDPWQRDPYNERFAWHLWKHFGELFTFLEIPGLDATNWRAELAMRFGVILRKVWGGNRTWRGARAQSVLMSVWRTCWQRSHSALDFVSQLLRSPAALLPLPP